MKVELTKEWCMNMAKIEARAAELHEGCQMPMEQARELAASEASPDWYARGQDWGLADALTNGQSGDWVLDDIARAFAAGAQAGGALESKRTHEVECQRVALEEQADLTAIHLARMQSALEQTASRSADYLRKAIKAEAEVALLRAALTLPADVTAARQTAEYWKAEHLAGNARIGELHDEVDRLAKQRDDYRHGMTVQMEAVASMVDLLHRMLESPTTQISVTWKDAVRQALALGPNDRDKPPA